MLTRSGVGNAADFRQFVSAQVDAVVTEPARSVRSAVEMSQLAAFTDAGRPLDRTNWANTFLSYYTYGAAIALAMDLSLRERSGGVVTLDDFMRAMWQKYGKPGGAREGYVDRPYTIDDAEARLAEVSGDQAFAHEFFSRYIRGREAADYKRLLEQAGFVLRKRDAGRGWWGDLRMDSRSDGGRILEVSANSPAYAAGLDRDDTVTQVGGEHITSAEEANAVMSRRKPGDRLSVNYVDRSGASKSTTVTLVENPHLEIVDASSLTAAQRAFRERWLGTQTRP
jgi:predicted metalloprotease with PDZ domain